MLVHVTFTDGSNPWLSAWLDKEHAIKKVNYFKKKYHVNDISIEIYTNNYVIEHDHNYTWFIRYDNKAKTFQRLGNAINFTERKDNNQ